MSTASVDRRTRRRQQTIDEILDVSIALMETEGVAALSLSAVARQLGMQPPSLYQYFPSKLAIYDALFQRGAEQFRDAQREAVADVPVEQQLAHGIAAFGRWCMANQVLSQLLFWRTVPGFEPSPEAFTPALEVMADVKTHLQEAVDSGRLREGAASEDGLALLTSMTAGLLSQQLANEPQASFEDGRYMKLIPVVLEMFFHHYAPTRGTAT
jgi:AcrR family transcriptional regulator